MRSAEMDAFVARVRDASDILSVVASYVPLKKKGGNYWGCCPFHSEKTPSFSVAPEKGFFYCFGCHAGGNVFKFISMIENISYFDAIRSQAEKLGIPMPDREKSEKDVEKERKIADLQRMMEMAKSFFHNCLVKTKYGTAGLQYFAGRGIGADVIEEFGLGFAPSAPGKLRDAFKKRGVSERLLLEGGLVAERQNSVYDKFRNRVMIPIADDRGRVVGFGGRVLGDGQPKYLNSPETLLFNKRRLLFGLDRAKKAIREEGKVILVEGYMDAISLSAAGIKNVVASLGTAFTSEQCRLLLRCTDEICFCYDSDEAGQRATMRALSIVRSTGARARVLIVPDGKDPDEFVRKHGADAFRKLLKEARSIGDFHLEYVQRTNDIRTLDGKNKALKALLPVLKESNPVEQNEYIQRLRSTLGIDEGIIRQEIAMYHDDGMRAEYRPRAERPSVRTVDDAVRRAGRALLRGAWHDPGVAVMVVAEMGEEPFPYPLHEKLLRYLAECAETGHSPSEEVIEETLGAEAEEEISHALIEEVPEKKDSYEACLRVLLLAQLRKAFEESRLRADAMEREGNSNFLQELSKSQRIKQRIDELNQQIKTEETNE